MIQQALCPSPDTINKIVEAIVSGVKANEEITPDTQEGLKVNKNILPIFLSIATNAWRAKMKMRDNLTGEVREDMRRIDRHIEAIYRNLEECGIIIRDHTGDLYDEGQPMKVIASKPVQGLQKKRVSDTLLPSIFWQNMLVQNGEIEIESPLATDIIDELKN